ncbi:E-selectin-like isoform X2 [Dreissena polymorpha]|uniref:E-selectin-like isoform X2 n=1 Tax=Dreissena polymorpha TaxID=45954 RepID=UPI002263E1FB|nr:E-selectin-like isoform X2 [Dreissena polymorpha]
MKCQVLMVVLLIAFVSCEATTNCTSNTTGIVDCGTTAAPPNATVAYPNCTVFESIANVTCNDGYRLVGRNNSDVFENIQCQSNGTWNASIGCTPKDCGAIAAQNTTVAYLNGTVFESIANVTCNDGYRLVGSNNKSDVFEYIQCQSNGMWNALRRCEPKENIISTSTPSNSSMTELSSSPSISAASTQEPFGNSTANGQDGSNRTVAATTKTWDQNGCSRLEAVWFVIAILLPVATTNF